MLKFQSIAVLLHPLLQMQVKDQLKGHDHDFSKAFLIFYQNLSVGRQDEVRYMYRAHSSLLLFKKSRVMFLLTF